VEITHTTRDTWQPSGIGWGTGWTAELDDRTEQIGAFLKATHIVACGPSLQIFLSPAGRTALDQFFGGQARLSTHLCVPLGKNTGLHHAGVIV
jgi:hypothetical protein